METKRSQFQQELNIVVELIQQCINENARVALDQAEYQKRYDEMASQLDSVQKQLNEVSQTIINKHRKKKLKCFLQDFKK